MPKEKKSEIYFDRKAMRFVGLTDGILNNLREIYKGIDVDRELKRMGLWLMSPKGKRRKGQLEFICYWLNNAITWNPITSTQDNLPEDTGPLPELIEGYLQELWKNREHLFVFNTKQ